MNIFGTKSEYKKEFPKQDPELIKAIVQESNLLIGQKLLEGEDFLMPESLGIIFIGKQKTKKVFDYINFCKTGIKNTINNFKTFGYLYKVMWFKGFKSHTNRSFSNIYKFRANRVEITRPLAQILKGGDDYYKDEDYIKRFYNGNKTIKVKNGDTTRVSK
jgi:hypothetical protein